MASRRRAPGIVDRKSTDEPEAPTGRIQHGVREQLHGFFAFAAVAFFAICLRSRASRMPSMMPSVLSGMLISKRLADLVGAIKQSSGQQSFNVHSPCADRRPATALVASPSQSLNPSFDCNRASYADEIMICAVDELAAGDLLTSTAFYQPKRGNRVATLVRQPRRPASTLDCRWTGKRPSLRQINRAAKEEAVAAWIAFRGHGHS